MTSIYIIGEFEKQQNIATIQHMTLFEMKYFGKKYKKCRNLLVLSKFLYLYY